MGLDILIFVMHKSWSRSSEILRWIWKLKKSSIRKHEMITLFDMHELWSHSYEIMPGLRKKSQAILLLL